MLRFSLIINYNLENWMFLITSIVQMSVTYILKRSETFMRKKSFYKPSNFLKSKTTAESNPEVWRNTKNCQFYVYGDIIVLLSQVSSTLTLSMLHNAHFLPVVQGNLLLGKVIRIKPNQRYLIPNHSSCILISNIDKKN